MTASRRRTWVVLAGLALVALAAVLVAGPGPGADAGPQGTLALRRLLDRMGLSVTNAGRPPAAPAVFVLLEDLRSTDQAQALLDWAHDGGTLVVTDPSSAVLADAGIATPGLVGLGSNLAPDCVTPESAGGGALAVDGTDSLLSARAPGMVGCFPKGGDYFEISDAIGSGRLVVLGGASPFTNALLNHAGNAAFAVQLFGSAGGRVAFGPALPPGASSKGLWQTLPLRAQVILIQIGVAAVAFAAFRARRFGKPPVERLPAPVPAGELVDAVGRLYRASRATGFAGDVTRAFILRRLQARTGAGGMFTPVDPGALSSTLAGLSGRDEESVRRLVAGPPPANDDELIALGRELEELRRQVEDSWT
jgi:hypothetical protein